MAAAPAACEWRDPGREPFMGDVPAAVDHYTDIPPATRARLQERMRRFDYDDMVAIRRDTITGRAAYRPRIAAMHFGTGRVCPEVTRHSWSAEHVERGLVYCEDGFCIMVPSVCRNVSRIDRLPSLPPVAAGPSAPADATPAGGPALPVSPASATEPDGAPVAAVVLGPPGMAIDYPPGPYVGWTPPPLWLLDDRPPGTPAFFDAPPGGGIPPVLPPVTPPLVPLVPLVPPVPPGLPDEPPVWPQIPPVTVVPPVPESPAWLMLAGGLALLLPLARRRRGAGGR